MKGAGMEKHPTTVEGFGGSIEDLAAAVAKMRYDIIGVFLRALVKEFRSQAKGDAKAGNSQLSHLLTGLVLMLEYVVGQMDKIWKLCKKHMSIEAN